MGIAAGLLLLSMAAAAPVPVPPTPPTPTAIDRNQATQFAFIVYNAAQNVQRMYVREVEMKEYMAGAIRGLYETAGVKLPDETLQAVNRAVTSGDLMNHLAEARVRLGNVPALSGPRSLFAAVNGFKHATDSISGLASPRVNTYVSIDMDFGLGLELEGVRGQRWNIYRMERGMALGLIPSTGSFGPLPKVDAVPSPAAFPWRVHRVIPGSPAQRAGVKPGDTITHLADLAITAANANRMFAQFAYPSNVGFDPNTGRPRPIKRSFQFKRTGQDQAINLTLETQGYMPESVAGVIRVAESKWDCLLDREYKIGYLRIGPIEQGTERKVEEMLDDLTKAGCRALILDLRWCPGGYVTPGTEIAGLFLRPNDVIAQVSSRVFRGGRPLPPAAPPGFNPQPGFLGPPPLPDLYRASGPTAGKFSKLPLLVLVGSETTGGGEMIAAALQDNRRATIMGQRTVGRASIQNAMDIGFGQLQFKVTTGATLRANGKPRGKLTNSKPTDDWGVKPDPGLEVPVTLAVSKQLRMWAEEQVLRPAESNAALPFDDPAKDPYRSAALVHLRKMLAARK
ncbi:MAG TPA: S41 family peptidase [Urbifossiella sp.]|nr:S41 family peptidase [Urbifossiella sp.]